MRHSRQSTGSNDRKGRPLEFYSCQRRAAVIKTPLKAQALDLSVTAFLSFQLWIAAGFVHGDAGD